MRNDRLERYERPTIVRRDRIEALLIDTTKSDPKQPPSDVNVKANIRPVAWSDETVAYTKPAIADRTDIAGFLTVSKSDPKNDGVDSDVNVKANIRSVEWRGETVAYTQPAIADRTPISGFLIVAKSDPKQDVATSDVAVKDNIVPVRW